MHPDLSPNLHSDECNALVQKLLQCRKDNKIGQLFGACNDIDTDMWICMKKERLARRERNREMTKERNQVLKEKLVKENPAMYKA